MYTGRYETKIYFKLQYFISIIRSNLAVLRDALPETPSSDVLPFGTVAKKITS
jgi:hypothetical protein